MLLKKLTWNVFIAYRTPAKLRFLYNVNVRLNHFRSSLSQMFFKIGILKYFTNFTGKHLCWSLFLIKLSSCEI